MMAKRDYRSEYENYQGSAKQKKNRAARNRARAEYEKKHGDLPSNVDVDHKKPIAKGGSKGMGNLRAVPQSKNRSFKRTKKAKMA